MYKIKTTHDRAANEIFNRRLHVTLVNSLDIITVLIIEDF